MRKKVEGERVPGHSKVCVRGLSEALDSAREMAVRQVEFFPTIEANAVRPLLDGKYTADVPVVAAEGKVEKPG